MLRGTESPDAVVCDVLMPGMSGLQFYRHLVRAGAATAQSRRLSHRGEPRPRCPSAHRATRRAAPRQTRRSAARDRRGAGRAAAAHSNRMLARCVILRNLCVHSCSPGRLCRRRSRPACTAHQRLSPTPTRCAAASARRAPGGTSRSTTCTSGSTRLTAASAAGTASPTACSRPRAGDADRPAGADGGRQHAAGRQGAHLAPRRQRVLRDADRRRSAPARVAPSRSITTASRSPPAGRRGTAASSGSTTPSAISGSRRPTRAPAHRSGGRTRTRRPTNRIRSASRSRCPIRCWMSPTAGCARRRTTAMARPRSNGSSRADQQLRRRGQRRHLRALFGRLSRARPASSRWISGRSPITSIPPRCSSSRPGR